MKKKYDEDERLYKYLSSYIKGMQVDKSLKPVLIDILMRRIYEYDLSKEDIKQDVSSLVNNLKTIEVKQFPKDEENVGGYYNPLLKKIVLNQKYVKEAKKDPNNPKLYEILTHEVYHVLCRDERGRDRLASRNSVTGQYNSSLLEAIVEKAADRCVYPRNTGVAPYYKQNVFGYSDITFITDAIAATYGVSEKDFLRNAIMGKDRLVDLLSKSGFERKEDTVLFLDKLEANYSRLHNTLYPAKKKEMPKSEKVNHIKNSMLGIYRLCEEKFAERIHRTIFTGVRQATNVENEAKFNHNKLTCVMENALDHFSRKYDRPDIMYDICRDVEPQRASATDRINDIDEVLKNCSRIPYEDRIPLINESKLGRLQRVDRRILSHFGIVLKDEKTFDESQSVQYHYFYTDFPEETWDNKDVCDYMARACSRLKNKSTLENILALFSRRNRKTQALLESKTSSENEIKRKEETDPFYKVSKNQLSKIESHPKPKRMLDDKEDIR